MTRTMYLLFQVTTNTTRKAISDRDLQTMLHPSMNYWFQYCDLEVAQLFESSYI